MQQVKGFAVGLTTAREPFDCSYTFKNDENLCDKRIHRARLNNRILASVARCDPRIPPL
jgi:hypothetical protein